MLKQIIVAGLVIGGVAFIWSRWDSLNIKSIVMGPACGEGKVAVFKSQEAIPAQNTATLLNTEVGKGVHFDNSRNWDELIQKAKLSDRHILLFFTTSTCGYCKMMKNTVLPQEQAGTVINDNFLMVPLQADQTSADTEQQQSWQDDTQKLVKKYEIGSFPTLIVCDPDGKAIAKAVGAMDAQKLSQWLIDALR